MQFFIGRKLSSSKAYTLPERSLTKTKEVFRKLEGDEYVSIEDVASSLHDRLSASDPRINIEKTYGTGTPALKQAVEGHDDPSSTHTYDRHTETHSEGKCEDSKLSHNSEESDNYKMPELCLDTIEGHTAISTLEEVAKFSSQQQNSKKVSLDDLELTSPTHSHQYELTLDLEDKLGEFHRSTTTTQDQLAESNNYPESHDQIDICDLLAEVCNNLENSHNKNVELHSHSSDNNSTASHSGLPSMLSDAGEEEFNDQNLVPCDFSFTSTDLTDTQEPLLISSKDIAVFEMSNSKFKRQRSNDSLNMPNIINNRNTQIRQEIAEIIANQMIQTDHNAIFHPQSDAGRLNSVSELSEYTTNKLVYSQRAVL
ncbi:hypothetical protein EB796_007976 [Bugula neritina]|uniref:Uncharacterized protein n=1 Tax=Bugula neritina TaxID=10212 RepID=A0A7J7K510_BUGNE|nr:hypothetical protein EB796_007976 [Bugula neritina]